MIEIIVEFSRYFLVLLFGTLVACNFAGMKQSKKNYLLLGCFTLFLFSLQIICLRAWGMDMTIKTYPVFTHIPVVVFIYLFFKRSWLISLTSTFASFLCCQLPRWLGTVVGVLFNSVSMNHIGYIASVLIMYYFLQKYAVKPVRHMLGRSIKSCLLFGAMPFFYYLFDFTTTVYTDFMYRGARVAVQFMPFVTAGFYFVFILFYYAETQKQAVIQREHDMLETQFKQAQMEFTSLKQLELNAIAYRHDMRHHFALLQSLAANENLIEIKEYLQSAQSDMDAITPITYCENETVNLILSAFVSKANQARITLSIDTKLPDTLPFSNTELCSLLSNALENATQASKTIDEGSERLIKLRMFSKNNKLCIDIRNKYKNEPTFHDGLPQAQEEGHGFGTKSMAYIVEKRGGVYQFSTKDGWFIFRATA